MSKDDLIIRAPNNPNPAKVTVNCPAGTHAAQRRCSLRERRGSCLLQSVGPRHWDGERGGISLGLAAEPQPLLVPWLVVSGQRGAWGWPCRLAASTALQGSRSGVWRRWQQPRPAQRLAARERCRGRAVTFCTGKATACPALGRKQLSVVGAQPPPSPRTSTQHRSAALTPFLSISWLQTLCSAPRRIRPLKAGLNGDLGFQSTSRKATLSRPPWLAEPDSSCSAACKLHRAGWEGRFGWGGVKPHCNTCIYQHRSLLFKSRPPTPSWPHAGLCLQLEGEE